MNIRRFIEWCCSVKNVFEKGSKHKILTLFGMKIKLDFLLQDEKYTQTSSIYGKIYLPTYNAGVKIFYEKPQIFNQNGKQMDIFFLRDHNSNFCPYGTLSQYFLWDRYNFALNTHFYTGRAIFETIAKPLHKFGMLVEPRAIEFDVYKALNECKDNVKDFEKILTHDEKILDDFANADFFMCVQNWCYNEKGDSLKPSAENYENKTKNISMVCSGKALTPIHLIRNDIASKLSKISKDYGGGALGLFGAFFNNPIAFKSQSLHEYRYQIVVENQISKYYFTEKILDCFISMCVPIYLGASDIGKFFNTDGIIIINEKDDIHKILKQCTPQDYEQRKEAILDNYQRSLKYQNVDDRLYETFFLR
ncbi:hypothetical protein DMB95_01915 [Campylobacter sp. MIT 12-8780]|uniref:hypothetical protein n=1 Tax=Campylobacter sp. MIT 12-8780 TaxID=2202200 RepID=UPI00115D71DE|nr:hypothetical protein [Campylobacter sp. MIT 12-8780]TQR42395.1 hypothetical protein DMB95_01915 [Campylobacter sp. MIT 12-8780]